MNFKIINPSIEYVPSAEFPYDSFFDKTAKISHNCYMVPEKDHASNIKFVEKLIGVHHYSITEHYRYIFLVDWNTYFHLINLNDSFITLRENKKTEKYYVSLSLRPLLEKYKDDPHFATIISALPSEVKKELFPNVHATASNYAMLVYSNEVKTSDPEFYDDLVYYTYHIITDRGVTHELVRHRLCSFAQESTRYCNYSKDKFENSLAFIKPLGYDKEKEVYDKYFNNVTETYFKLINDGLKPEEARSVLPNSLKASIMVTASVSEWKHIFDQRISEAAHPDIRIVMGMVRDDMKKRELL